MKLSLDLLEQASHLARREKKRPRQASLRRSVSCSYYALFHLLTAESVAIVGPNLEQAASQRVQRWFNHNGMKRVGGMFSVPVVHRQFTAILGGPVSINLQLVSKSFIQLQEARRDADYNLASNWTRLTAQQYAETAKNAFAAWDQIRRTHEANVFALALLSEKLFEQER